MIADGKNLQLALTGRLVEVYGPQDGLKNSGVLVPAILKDFTGMLKKAAVGDTVTETYRTEDGVAEITLRAVKTAGESNVQFDIRRR